MARGYETIGNLPEEPAIDPSVVMAHSNAIRSVLEIIQNAQREAQDSFGRNLAVNEVYTTALVASGMGVEEAISRDVDIAPEELLKQVGWRPARANILLQEAIGDAFSDWNLEAQQF